MAFAVIKTGGKQYRVTEGAKIKIEKIEAEVGKDVTFDEVLLKVDGEKIDIGTPTVKGASVSAKVVEQDKHPKVIVFKYKSKTRQRTKNTHKQPYTEVQIQSIK